MEIAVLGHILEEKIIFPDRELYPVLGSPAAYSSVCMGKLGVGVGLVTKIGGDFPAQLLQVLEESRVDTRGVSFCGSSTRNELIYDSNGEKRLNFLARADSLVAEDVPPAYRDAKLLYICPIDNEIGPEALRDLSGLGAQMVVDLGGYGGGTSAAHPTDKSGSFVQELCPFFSVVKASLEDLVHILGPEIDERKAAQLLVGWGAGSCVVTLGDRGSYVHSAGERKHYPPFPPTVKKMVDQTGAGDCFSAGMLSCLVENGDVHEAAIFGTATTSYVIERTGGVTASRMPDLEEVKRRVGLLREAMAGKQ